MEYEYHMNHIGRENSCFCIQKSVIDPEDFFYSSVIEAQECENGDWGLVWTNLRHSQLINKWELKS